MLKAKSTIFMSLLTLSLVACPPLALAEEKSTDGYGNGLQSQDPTRGVDYQGFITEDDGEGGISGTWKDSDHELPSAGDYYTDGKVHLFVNTLEGKWKDNDGGLWHDNGTYVVTIPTKIAYDNVHVGIVDTSDDYTVNVRGVIKENQKVVLRAESGNALVNGSKKDELFEDTTQGKTEWTPAETFGNLVGEHAITGTNCTDNIKLHGTVTTAGIYEGSVTYVASLEEA